MPRSVKLDDIKLRLAAVDCMLVSVSLPLNTKSKVTIKCHCSRDFEMPLRRMYEAINRRLTRSPPNHTLPQFSCGCVSKKWTNTAIQTATESRNLRCLTDCDVPGFQPSVMKLDWVCTVCNHRWRNQLDTIVNKNVGCPQCAGNLAYTVDTLTLKLATLGRCDLDVCAIIPGKSKTLDSPKKSPHGLFTCRQCKNTWTADIHNVIKFGYGCPPCNANIGSPCRSADGTKFHSKLERYAYEALLGANIQFERQKRYTASRRHTCDFFIPSKEMWVEISGKALLATDKYRSTIDYKRDIVENQYNQSFEMLTSIPQINQFIKDITTV